jgi:hypothetical protein
MRWRRRWRGLNNAHFRQTETTLGLSGSKKICVEKPQCCKTPWATTAVLFCVLLGGWLGREGAQKIHELPALLVGELLFE